MFKNIFLVFLLVCFVSMPVYAHATRPDSQSEVLLKQIVALQSYITRTYGAQVGEHLTETELRLSIQNGVMWLKKAQEESGHFRYEYVPYEGIYRQDDNIVRQAGALYALGEILNRTENDSLKVKTTIEHSIDYLAGLSLRDTYGEKSFRCITKSASSVHCPLGATALALVGTLSYATQSQSIEATYRKLIQDYVTYILAMQKENGGFRDTYTIEGTKLSEAESAFSNGEALLALVRYYSFKPTTEIKDAIDRTFTYLESQPYDANLYLWIMAALTDMHELWPNEEYVTYTKAFTEWRLDRAEGTRGSLRNYCAYAEGLASAIRILETTQSPQTLIQFRNELDTLNQKHYRLQLTPNDEYRVLSKNGKITLETLKAPEWAYGGFLTEDKEPTQRIDFTQHCLGAYMQTLVDLNLETLD